MSLDNQELRDLVGVEKWEEIFLSEDKMRIQDEMASLQESLKELQSLV
jgi:hypothetical protein